MSKLAFTDRHLLNAENVRKLLVAMGKDVRVLLVKLADRLHNMKTLGVMEEEKRRRISRETLELYAPLANRLGMGTVRLELEDLAFRQLEPEQHAELCSAVERKRAKLSATIQEIHGSLQAILRQQGIQAQVYGRIKHLYGIYKKMGTQAKGFEDIHDWLAYRIICPDRASCYTALGFGRMTVHKLIEPLIPELERAKPKENTSNLLDSVVVGDTTGILYTLAACCKPIWGDEVIGYITRTRGTAIHRADCPQLNTATLLPERRVSVAWGKHGTELYDTELTLTS